MVFLGILAFLLSVMGSFIVRSGIINSVHAFASDPSRGVFLLSLFGLFSFSFCILVLTLPLIPTIESFGYLFSHCELLLKLPVAIIFSS